jgi:FtsP/CotA-like multicopper oxidase with cupredoxin domain
MRLHNLPYTIIIKGINIFQQIPLNTIVEMVLIDKGYAYDANHPFHLHGHSFRVVAMERVGSQVNVSDIRKMDLDGQIQRNLKDAPLKDTVTVPDGGFTIIRFKTSNPGNTQKSQSILPFCDNLILIKYQ